MSYRRVIHQLAFARGRTLAGSFPALFGRTLGTLHVLDDGKKHLVGVIAKQPGALVSGGPDLPGELLPFPNNLINVVRNELVKPHSRRLSASRKLFEEIPPQTTLALARYARKPQGAALLGCSDYSLPHHLFSSRGRLKHW
ncbi:MAG TPA: hypothetical protein VFG14_03900 [Chthoniobacteraceae bacterium]|nr:hypothetical protein [Chthoniobacteraceae bacterium]